MSGRVALSPEQYARVETLFAEALERDLADRAEFLRRACPDDPLLHAEVRSLLAAHETPGPITDPESLPSLQWVGPYRLVRELGTGGMGTVYLAERPGSDAPRVALKLLGSDFALPVFEIRLLRERDILGRLEHPGIARLVDGGTTPTGQPYIATEYVPGTDIMTHAEARQLRAEARVQLIAEVCDAVHHAHGQRVIHRDLKPGNILVTPEGQPKLLDFGIATLLDPEGLPGRGQTGGFLTPAYASPEQAVQGPATAQTDVYALGVVLYQLLTGSLPYQVDERSWPDLARSIAEAAPKPPSQAARESGRTRLARALAGDLDAIVGRATAKDPARRYRSAGELAEDLRRYLGHRPVLARPGSAGYRLGKLLRRHRTTVIVGMGIAVVLAAIVLAG